MRYRSVLHTICTVASFAVEMHMCVGILTYACQAKFIQSGDAVVYRVYQMRLPKQSQSSGYARLVYSHHPILKVGKLHGIPFTMEGSHNGYSVGSRFYPMLCHYLYSLMFCHVLYHKLLWSCKSTNIFVISNGCK